MFVVIEPGHGKSGQVTMKNSIDSPCSGKGVGTGFAEYMADSAAGRYLHSATTLPQSEGHFKILTSPNIHLVIIGSRFPEVVSVDAEETSSHDRCGIGSRGVLSHQVHLTQAHDKPSEVELPVEGAPVKSEGLGVLEGVIVDDVNHRTHHSFGILSDSVQERLQPTLSTFAVSIKKSQNFYKIKKSIRITQQIKSKVYLL